MAQNMGQKIGMAREFALTAYQLAFAERKDLSLTENILEVVRRVGLDLGTFQEKIQSPKIKNTLRAATDRAGDEGIDGVPTMVVNGKIYFGDDQLELAAQEIP